MTFISDVADATNGADCAANDARPRAASVTPLSSKSSGFDPHDHFNGDGLTVADAVMSLSARHYDERELWFKILAGAKSYEAENGGTYNNDDLYPLVQAFSSQSVKYPGDREFRKIWNSIKPDGGITIGTVFYLAEQDGWIRPRNDPPEGYTEGLEGSLAAMKREWFDLGSYSTSEYLKRKGITQKLHTAGKHSKCKRDGDKDVFAPIDLNGMFCGLQDIHDDGRKMFRKWSMPKGACIPFGKYNWSRTGDVPILDGFNKVILAEGIATAACIADALEAKGEKIPVLATLSCHFMEYLAGDIRRRYPGMEIVISSDDDRHRSDNPGMRAANRAARENYARVMRVPSDFGEPDQGVDFWDLFSAKAGPEKVYECFQRAAFPARESLEQEQTLVLAQCRILDMVSKPAPLQRFAIPDLLEKGKTHMIVAPGATNKSWAMLQMGCSSAAGFPLFGKLPTEWGTKTLYLSYEDTVDDLHRRIERIIDLDTPEGEDVAYFRRAVTENFRPFSLHGRYRPLLERNGKKLQNSAFVQEIVSVARDFGADIIQIDPLSRTHEADENSNPEMSRLVHVFNEIACQTDAAVLVAHHVSKGALHNGVKNQTAGRGASSLVDDPRATYQMAAMTDAEAKTYGIRAEVRTEYVSLGLVKANHLQRRPELWLNRKNGVLRAVDLSPGGAAEPDVSKVLDVIRASVSNDDLLGRRELEDRYGGTKRELGISGKDLRVLREAALRQGKLKLVPAGELLGRFKSAAGYKTNTEILMPSEAATS